MCLHSLFATHAAINDLEPNTYLKQQTEQLMSFCLQNSTHKVFLLMLQQTSMQLWADFWKILNK